MYELIYEFIYEFTKNVFIYDFMYEITSVNINSYMNSHTGIFRRDTSWYALNHMFFHEFIHELIIFHEFIHEF